MGTNQQTSLTPLLPATVRPSSAHTAKEVTVGSNYLSQLPLDYDCRHVEYPTQHSTSNGYKNNLHDMRCSFEEIPESQATAMPTIPHEARLQQREQQQQSNEVQRSPQQSPLPIICVDDETIVLTEDEEETLVSSHDYNEEMDDEDDDEDDEAAAVLANRMPDFGSTTTVYADASSNESQNRYARESVDNDVVEAADEEEEYVDILSNDDDDLNPPNSANFTQHLQCQALEEEIAKSGKALTRNKLIYDNEELHHRAIDGLAKLFEKDFLVPTHVEKRHDNNLLTRKQTNSVLTATNEADLSEHNRAANVEKLPAKANSFGRTHQQRSHKSERKRMKLRKHHHTLDEETMSPVSGTIIRKLRDDEELVVRKGDIDPAFNVVEITEEAKAILASIDNKIGDYLCQLCRTLYDDAFQLAQHRCPRIVHIEYKCSECEKVGGASARQLFDNQCIYFFCLGLQLSC